ncbi:unnamed protein product [Caretta caretta]
MENPLKVKTLGLKYQAQCPHKENSPEAQETKAWAHVQTLDMENSAEAQVQTFGTDVKNLAQAQTPDAENLAEVQARVQTPDMESLAEVQTLGMEYQDIKNSPEAQVVETEAQTHAEIPDMKNSAEAQALGIDYQPQFLTQSMAMKNLDRGQVLAKED